MHVVKFIKEIVFASIVSVLLMTPFGSVFSESLLDPEPENNTIPLWGPTWCKDTVTWRIDNADKISANALVEIQDGIEEWRHHAPSGINLVEFDPEVDDSPDMVIQIFLLG